MPAGGVAADHDAPYPGQGEGAVELHDRLLSPAAGHHGQTEETVRSMAAILGEPIVIGPHQGSLKFGVATVPPDTVREAWSRIQQLPIDAVNVDFL